jgi:hypothetical protein
MFNLADFIFQYKSNNLKKSYTGYLRHGTTKYKNILILMLIMSNIDIFVYMIFVTFFQKN